MRDGLRLHDRLDYVWQQLVGIAFAALEVVVVILVCYLLAGRVRGVFRRRLKDSPMPMNAKILVENLSAVATYLIGITVLLALWNVTWSAVLAAVSAGTIVIALGFQAILQSIVGGIFILFERPFTIGDHIHYSIHGVDGVVEEIGLRSTVIRSANGDRTVVPNSLIFTNAMENRSPDRSWKTTVTVRRVDVTPTVARTQAEAAIANVPGFAVKPEIKIRSYLARFKKPQRTSTLPVGEQLVQSALARATFVEISWTGVGDRELRDTLIRQLKEYFPDASIRVRRY